MPVWAWAVVGTLLALLALFLMQMLAVGAVFAALYGRVEHRFSRRALFDDLPEYRVTREKIAYGRGKYTAVYLLGEGNKGLVVIAHGIRDRGEGYFTEARGFLARGFRVLLYDAVGSGASSGRSQRGLPQSAYELDRVLCHVEKDARFAQLPVYLYGHSWGGYAVCAVFALRAHPRVKAVCSLSGFNAPCKMLFDGLAAGSRPLAVFLYPAICAVQFLRYGRGMRRTAEEGIRAAEDTRFLILHAEEDELIAKEGASVYALREKLACARVQFALRQGRGHLNASLSPAAAALDAAQDARLRALAGRGGWKLSKEQEAAFYAPIDRAARIALGEPDGAFFTQIAAFYEGELCPNTI